jgi:hypothetical protein
MRIFGRFALGFVIGCILIVWAVGLAAAGHGTFAPIVSGAPELLPFLAAAEKWGLSGFWLVVVPAAGLLWAVYFGLLPAIKSFVVRVVVVIIICLVHFGATVWSLSKDPGFARMADAQPVPTIGFFVFFWVVILAFGARTWAGPNFRLRDAAPLD